MKDINEDNLPAGTTAYFANMHKWLQRGLFVCLVVLVIGVQFVIDGIKPIAVDLLRAARAV